MAVVETLTYTVKSIEGDESPEKSISLKLNVIKNNSKYLLHRAIVAQDSNNRQGTACTKTRSEVRAGGKKPWKQKGTGQARSGSKNSPLWNGGGVAFGPRPRSYKKKINSKESKLALQTALFNCKTKITVIDKLWETLDKPNTKKALENLKKFRNRDDKTLLVIKEPNPTITLSIRNIEKVDILYSNTLNVKNVLLATNIIITKDALENIQKTYHD